MWQKTDCQFSEITPFTEDHNSSKKYSQGSKYKAHIALFTRNKRFLTIYILYEKANVFIFIKKLGNKTKENLAFS